MQDLSYRSNVIEVALLTNGKQPAYFKEKENNKKKIRSIWFFYPILEPEFFKYSDEISSLLRGRETEETEAIAS